MNDQATNETDPTPAQNAIERIEAEDANQAQPQESLLQFFVYGHLPPHLQEISKPFADLARMIFDNLPRNPERTVALRKLLEAKDCAVRANIFK